MLLLAAPDRWRRIQNQQHTLMPATTDTIITPTKYTTHGEDDW